jgi:hypothetical protein
MSAVAGPSCRSRTSSCRTGLRPVAGPAAAVRSRIRPSIPRAETREEGINRLRYGVTQGNLVYFTLRYAELGPALEAAGDREGAARAYSQFIRLWENADPDLQPRVETARRALERLTAERAN